MVTVPESAATGSRTTLYVPACGRVPLSTKGLPQQHWPHTHAPSGLYTVVAHASSLDCASLNLPGRPSLPARRSSDLWPGTVVLSAAVVPALVGVIAWVASGGTS